MANTTLLSLTDAKTQLGIDTPKHDAELQVFINACAKFVESQCGNIDAAAHTQRFSGGERSLVLDHCGGDITVTAITPDDGGTWSTSGLTYDHANGIVSSPGLGFPASDFTVTYSLAARDPADFPNLVLACGIIVQHGWETRRGSGQRRPGQGGTETRPGLGFAIPYRAESYMWPHVVRTGLG